MPKINGNSNKTELIKERLKDNESPIWLSQASIKTKRVIKYPEKIGRKK